MNIVRFCFATFFILLGLFISITGLLGFYKLKFILNRMHAAALIDTLGLFFIVLGLIIAKGFVDAQGNFDMTSIKLALVVFILWITSPVSSHIISKLIYLTDTNTDLETVEIDVEESSGDKDGQ
ncbi:MAG: monovalent cation/H(+) antiporter subunit G [Erysipelotrichaceae bacterium]|nr:monovalent cation/H(+) antiporter subunit G [Erysipelotrichaceae bacterium]